MEKLEKIGIPFIEDLDQQIQAQKEYIEVLEYKGEELETKFNTIENEIEALFTKRQIALQELSRLNGIKKTCES
jgi:hypothetical protein